MRDVRMLLPEVRSVDADALYDLYDGAERHVRAGMVVSADGSTAYAGSSRPLSGPADRVAFRALRAVADVVLVGAATARSEGYGRIPLRPAAVAWRAAHARAEQVRLAVVSRSLDVPESALQAGPVVLTCAASPRDRRERLSERADVVVVGDDDVHLPGAVDALAERGLSRVLCEGGPALLSAVTAAGVLDELCLTVSPLLAGGAPGLLPDPLPVPLPLRLVHLLEDDGELLARYATVQ